MRSLGFIRGNVMFTSIIDFVKKNRAPRFGFNMILVFSMLLMPISPSVLGQSGNLAGQEKNSIILTANQAPFDKEAQNCHQGHQCALRFNGVNQWVQLDQFRGFDTPAFTLETWFNWSGTGTSVPEGNGSLTDGIPFISIGDTEGNISLFFGLQASTGQLLTVFEAEHSLSEPTDQEYSLTGNTQVASDGWHHAATTFDGQTLRLYLDGNLDAEQTFDTAILPQLVSAREVFIAAVQPSNGNGSGFFKGVLDEVRIWEVARSQSELQEAAGLENLEEANLIGHWSMNEGFGVAVKDSSRKDKQSEAYNTPEWTDGITMSLSVMFLPELATSANLVPDAPVLVSPADGATDVSSSPTLSVVVNDPESQNLAVTFYGRAAPQTSQEDFTLAVLPDTQLYSKTYLTIFGIQTQWIVDHQSELDIAFVAHLGDMVDDWNVPRQWDVANAAMSKLEPPGIAYGIGIGNCDEDNYGVPPATTFFNKYFPASRFAGRPYYGGAYNGDNANSYQIFSAGGLDFIVIDLKFNLSTVPTESQAVLAWAHNLLQTYPNRRAIVITHNLLSTSNVFSNDGLNIYNALKDSPNLFLMMGGHLDTEGMRTDPGTDGHTIYSLRSDYQTRPNGGNGWLRLLRFSPETNKIYVTTYSPYLDQYETDADSQFSLAYNMNGSSFGVLGTVNVASGSIASLSWPGLVAGGQYDWYVSVNDGTSSSSGPVWSFTTANGGTTAPVVTTQPSNLAVTAGQTATFIAEASGNPTPTVQWQVSSDGSNWNNIGGATSTTYSFTAQAGENLKQYRAVFTNSAGSATTTAVTLTVNTLPVVTLQPVSMVLNAGQSATFTATASGSPTPTVQWQVSTNGTTWSDIVGANSNTYTFTVQPTDNGKQYHAAFSNVAGSASTASAVLTVYSLPVVIQQPLYQTVTAGQTATFTAAASGNPTPTVQWQVSTDGSAWDNVAGATSSTYSFTTSTGDNGKLYRAVFTNSVGSTSSTAALLTVNSGPVITLQPANLTVNAGQTASFSASASGTPAPTVQWQVSIDGTNWNNIAGATSISYSFTTTSTDNGKHYRAIFTNTAGSATTNGATLTVNAAPIITTQPLKQTVNAGQSVSFTAGASGSPTPTVQWQVSSDGILWSDITEAVATTYSFIAQSADHGKQYRAVFTNPAGSATTNSAILYVNTPPVVTSHPSPQTVNAGQTTTFSAAASGVPVPTVHWQVSSDGTTWVDIPAATSTTYTFTAQAADNGKQYRAIFTNDAGSVATNSASLTVNVAPAITTQPANQSVIAGQTAIFSAAANGSPTPSVQWQWSPDGSAWTDIVGATSITYSFTTQLTDNGKRYRAVFTNIAGSASSNAALLTVTAGTTTPVVTLQPADQTVNAGQTVSFTASASGNPVPTVQWQVSSNGTTWSDITGATSTTYSFTVQSIDNNKQFRAVFTNSAGNATTNSAHLTVYTAPSVTAQPINQTVTAGQVASFTAVASGSPTPTVQWQVNDGTGWIDISGANLTTFSFTAFAADNGKQYHAIFTNAAGSITSQAAVLTVYTVPVVSQQPANLAVTSGQMASFSATSTGYPVPSIQWQVNGGSGWLDILEATSSLYTFTSQATDNGKQYRAVFTNAAGSAISNAATLTVNTATVITTQPANQTVNAGLSVSFTAAASGSPTPTVKWQVSSDGSVWSDIAGATSTTYTFTSQASDNGNQLRAIFTNVAGSAATNSAALMVYIPPVVTIQPVNQTITAGQTVSFTAAASGNPTPTVQWQVSSDGTTWNPISGATNPTYTFTAQADDNGKQYRAVFTNSAGSATSNSASLTVYVAPTITTQPSNQTVNAGQTVTFTASANGTPTPTVQWQVSINSGTSWTDLASATSVTYSFTTQAVDNGKQYRAIFTNAAGSVNTNAAVLTVFYGPAITTQPISLTVNEGQGVSFTAAANGSPIPTVQWQMSLDGSSWSNISGATSTTYSFTALVTDNGKQFRAIFTNLVGSATSNIAILTVNSDLIFADNFNSCNASAWSGGTVNPARLAFNTTSGRNSTCGMAVSVTSSAAYVIDPSPNAEAQLRARFYFNPNTLRMSRNDIVTIYSGYNTSAQATVTLQIRPSGSAFQVRAGAMRASRKWSYTSWVALSKAWHSVEFNWIAATAAGANNGSLTLWLDGVQSSTLTAIDNDLQRIASVRLGIVEGMDGTTLGTIFFDDFVSRRTSYIGQ